MAHYAQLDKNNRVVCVHSVDDQYVMDENGNESESLGIAHCEQLNLDAKFVQTSISGSFRHTFASIDYYYLEDEDVFVRPKPYDSWTLNRDTYEWESPIPSPVEEAGQYCIWDEETTSWKSLISLQDK